MDRTSTWLIRASLGWLLGGAIAGAVMMADSQIPGAWRVWLGPTHGHALFVGWFLQFTVGIATWLLPRTRTTQIPLGYRERPLWIAMAGLNAGLLLRVAAEPRQRAGHHDVWVDPALIASGLLQVMAIALIVRELWPRVATRTRRINAAATPQPSVHGDQQGA